MNTFQLILVIFGAVTGTIAATSLVFARRERNAALEYAELRKKYREQIQLNVGLRAQVEGLKLTLQGATEREAAAARRKELEAMLDRGDLAKPDTPLHIGGFAVTQLASEFKKTEVL